MSNNSNNDKKRSPAELWKAIERASVEDDIEEVLAMSDAEVDAYLASNGMDPQKLRADGERFVRELQAKHDRLAWHGDMEAKVAKVRAAAEAKKGAPRERLPRAELFARIDAARNDPRFTEPVSALFRGKTPEASTDEELEALLDQIELLAMLEDER